MSYHIGSNDRSYFLRLTFYKRLEHDRSFIIRHITVKILLPSGKQTTIILSFCHFMECGHPFSIILTQ